MRESVPVSLAFEFSDLHVDGDALSQSWQRYLRLVGRFSIAVGEIEIFSEQEFCLVEFGIQSQLWLRRAAETGEDFIYTSEESEEPGLVWIKKLDEVWHLGTITHVSSTQFAFDVVRSALGLYFEKLRHAVLAKYELDIVSLFSWLA